MEITILVRGYMGDYIGIMEQENGIYYLNQGYGVRV